MDPDWLSGSAALIIHTCFLFLLCILSSTLLSLPAFGDTHDNLPGGAQSFG